MERTEMLNTLEGVFKKTATTLATIDAVNNPEVYIKLVNVLSILKDDIEDLKRYIKHENDPPIVFSKDNAFKFEVDKPEEPYVEEPPHGEPEPVEEVEKVDRAELQKRISKARAEKGINPKELVSKYADKFSNVKDEDLPKLKADLEEALRNA